MIDSVLATFGLFGGAFVIGFCAGMFPIISIELFLIGIGTWASPTPGDMTLIVELYDAPSGVLVARIVDPEKAREYRVLKMIDRIFVEAEAQRSFANAARLAREALNVAITERPR